MKDGWLGATIVSKFENNEHKRLGQMSRRNWRTLLYIIHSLAETDELKASIGFSTPKVHPALSLTDTLFFICLSFNSENLFLHLREHVYIGLLPLQEKVPRSLLLHQLPHHLHHHHHRQSHRPRNLQPLQVVLMVI